MTTVKSFSLPDEVISVLDSIPKNERSEFVSQAILEAAQQKMKLRAIKAMQSFEKFSPDINTPIVDIVREIRKKA